SLKSFDIIGEGENCYPRRRERGIIITKQCRSGDASGETPWEAGLLTGWNPPDRTIRIEL
ncbi:MAG: hypothetical protein IJI07_10370, partial [Flexilinea sp.]|nr:hypothetical protein [Flexilinea sp.]